MAQIDFQPLSAQDQFGFEPAAPVYNIGQDLLRQIAGMQQQTEEEIPRGSERDIRDVLSGLATGLGGGAIGQQLAPQKSTLLDKLIQGASGFAPYAATAEASIPAEGASLLERLGAQSAAGGAYGGVTERTPQAILEGMGLGAAGELAGGLLGALSPTKIARTLGKQAVPRTPGLRTPEEVAQISEKLGDLPVNVFDVIGYQPGARGTTATLGAIPFSGYGSTARDVQHAVNSQADKISQNLFGASTEPTLTSDLQNDVYNTYKDLNNTIGNKFSEIADLADEAGVKVNTSNVQNAAQKILDIEDKKLIPDLSNELRKKLTQIAEKDPQETNYKDAHFAHSSLTQTERNLLNKQDYGSARNIPLLKEALQQDMSEGLEKAGLTNLQNDWDAARKEFATQVAPFRDKKIYNKLSGKVSPKSLHTALTDGSATSDLVLNLLPQETRNKIGASYIAQASKKDEKPPEALLRGYAERIPKAVRDKLFTPEMHSDFDKLDALLSSSPETRLYLNQPFTGGRTGQTLKAIGTGLAGLGLMHAGVTPTEIATLLPAISAASRGATKAITSPAARQFYATAPQRTGSLETLAQQLSRIAPAALVPGGLSTLQDLQQWQ